VFNSGKRLTPLEESRNIKRALDMGALVKDIAAGERFTAENVTTARPGLGVSASDLEWMFEQECRDWIKAGEPVTWKHLPPPF
jgi:sialic acid synthase SpsE